MANELPAGATDGVGFSRRFWLHLGDNFFRHVFLFLAPVVLLTVTGVAVSQRSEAEFKSLATLDSAANPLVEDLVAGSNSFRFLTPAQSTANQVNEQLRTDVFASDVAVAAGIDTSFIEIAVVRNNVSARANGNSLVDISATWADPQTAAQLAGAAIETYREYVEETATQQSASAEDFFIDLRDQALAEADLAEQELDGFVATLAPLADNEEYSVAEQVRLTRFQQALERADSNVQSAENQIQQAQLQVAQTRSEAGQSFRVIDQPSVPIEAESHLFQMISLILVFIALGVLVSVAALLVTTAFDRTVRFDLDIVAVAASPIVASVPSIKALRRLPTGTRGFLLPFDNEKSLPPGDSEAVDDDDEPAEDIDREDGDLVDGTTGVIDVTDDELEDDSDDDEDVGDDGSEDADDLESDEDLADSRRG